MVTSFSNIVSSNPAQNGSPGLDRSVLGNQSLELPSITMIEIGTRLQLTDNLQLDATFFQQRIENFSNLTTLEDSFDPITNTRTLTRAYQNSDLEATQLGTSFALNWVPNSHWSIKPFITLQQTDIENLTPTEPEEVEHGSTPNFYGGAYINFKVLEKLNINVSPYLMASYELYNTVDLQRPSEEGLKDANLILNAKISYAATEKFNVFISGRNIGGGSSEFYGSDEIDGVYLTGLSYNF